MFTFQKEVIINSADQFFTKGGKYVIDGMVYDPSKIDHVYVTKGDVGQKAVITIANIADKMDASGPNEVTITLGLDKQYRGDFASVASYFSKEISVYTDRAHLAEALTKAISSDIMTVTATNETGAATELTAVDTYITVKKIEVIKADGTVEPVVATSNRPEFGTYNYIMNNLRLPSSENMRYKSPVSVELPVYGGVYDQYSFAYDVERNIGGMSVVGQKTTSRTIHTFYVLDKLSPNFVVKGETQKKPNNNAEDDNGAPTSEE